MTWAIAVGNPFDGITLHGPFDNSDEAGEHAEIAFRDSEWWLVEIQPVEEGHS